MVSYLTFTRHVPRDKKSKKINGGHYFDTPFYLKGSKFPITFKKCDTTRDCSSSG